MATLRLAVVGFLDELLAEAEEGLPARRGDLLVVEVPLEGVGGGHGLGARLKPGAPLPNDVPLDGGEVVGAGKGLPDGGVVDAVLEFLREADGEADDGVVEVVALDGLDDAGGGVEVVLFEVDVDGNEAAGVDWDELEVGEAGAAGLRGSMSTRQNPLGSRSSPKSMRWRLPL